MTRPPAEPKIYHITHVDNLPGIIAQGGLLADARMRATGRPVTTIGMADIKQRRLGLPVPCHPGDQVGDYVPFYFCPRSIMLYLLYRGNHPELSYRGGQEPIVHLEADLYDAVAWAKSVSRRWAFSLSNAGAMYAEFRSSLADLDQINWDAVTATDFRSREIKEGKQAEFLVHGSFPWSLIRRIGVYSYQIRVKVEMALQAARYRPAVEIKRDWYY